MSTSSPARRPMLLNPLWLQGAILTFVIGFAILFYLAIRIYQDHAPVPGRIVDEAGETFLTEEDILQGQEQFLTYGLMQFGTVYGHGAYLGPDFTADYLHRMALHMTGALRRRRGGRERSRQRAAGEPLRPGDGDAGLDRRARSRPSRRSIEHFGELVYGRKVSGEGLKAEHDRRRRGHRARSPPSSPGRPGRPRPGGPARRTRTRTTGRPRSWSATPLTGDAIMWSALSLVALLGGIGLVLGVYGRYSRIARLARDRRSGGCGSCPRPTSP